MKYNTDDDLLNAFTKHIEVITAALGITFVEMASLKKLFYHKSRLLEARRRRARQQSMNNRALVSADSGNDGGREVVSGLRALGIAARVRTLASTTATARDDATRPALSHSVTPTRSHRPSFYMTQWQSDMMRKCDETLVLLRQVHTSAQEMY